MLDLGFGVLDLGFRVSCFGTQSRHPSGEMDDIPNLIKHWPCAVKTHFPGQHTRPGRNSTIWFATDCSRWGWLVRGRKAGGTIERWNCEHALKQEQNRWCWNMGVCLKIGYTSQMASLIGKYMTNRGFTLVTRFSDNPTFVGMLNYRLMSSFIR